MQLVFSQRSDEIVERWGMVPARVVSSDELDKTLLRPDRIVVERFGRLEVRDVMRPVRPSAYGDVLTLITCIFLHGGWMHFLGNMWFLHIFGDNVEDRMGHMLYGVLYISGGVLASVAQIAVDPSSTIPTIGASGAIAAVMGAYVMLYPHAVVETLIPLPILFATFPIPAPLFLGVWFLIQLYNGTADQLGGSAGVAWWAHIGGFVVGFIAAIGLNTVHWLNPPVPEEQQQRRGLFGL